MAEKSTEQLEYECANLLKEFGFSEYEAYTFVYLLRLETGTAKDVAEIGDVPRTRVYDAVEALHEAGLVDIQYTSPKKFTPVSRESALRKLDLQRENTITELSELFEQLEPATKQPEELGVWTVTGHEAVTSRLFEFIDDAEDELIYMTVDELLTDDHLDHLEAAEERGVDIYLAGLSEPVQAQIQERVPSAELFETLWAWSEEGAGSLLITDKRTAFVSVLVDQDATDSIHETGIWGTGERNSLVVLAEFLPPTPSAVQSLEFTSSGSQSARTPGSAGSIGPQCLESEYDRRRVRHLIERATHRPRPNRSQMPG